MAHLAATDSYVTLREDLDAKKREAQERWAAFSGYREKHRGALEAKGKRSTKFAELERLHDEYLQVADECAKLERKLLDGFDRRTKLSPGGGSDGLGAAIADGFKTLLGGSGGGAFIAPPEFLDRVWDRLRPRSVGLASGFTLIPTDQKEVHLPKITADATAAWIAEGAAATAADPTIAEEVVVPRKLFALNNYSSELLMDSRPAVGDMIVEHFLKILGAKLDLGFFEGTGTPPEIRGLKNVAGIQSVSMGTNGLMPVNLDPFADAIGLLATANAEAGAIAMHPRTWGTLAKLKEQTSGNNKPLLQESAGSGGQGIERRIYGVPVLLTSQLSITETQGTSTDCSSAYVYEPGQVVAVSREEFRFEADPGPGFSTDTWQVRGIMRFGLAVPNPPAVCRILGIRAV